MGRSGARQRMPALGAAWRHALVALMLLGSPAATASKKKKSGSSAGAARQCACCEFLTSTLQRRASKETETTFEVGWRLKDDGTRVGKRVAWVQSELGFGAAVEAACGASGGDGDGDASLLEGLVQVALGDELGLRSPVSAEEAEHTLREDSLDLFRSSCIEFVFSHEEALDAIRDGWEPSAKTQPSTSQLMREVCTRRAKVCPKSRWKRWQIEGAAVEEQEPPSLVKIVPRAAKTPNPTKKRLGDRSTPAPPSSWVADLLMASPLLSPIYESFGLAPFIIFVSAHAAPAATCFPGRIPLREGWPLHPCPPSTLPHKRHCFS